jgi:hypothetical protein
MSRLAIEHFAERHDYRGIDGTCKERGVKGEKQAELAFESRAS